MRGGYRVRLVLVSLLVISLILSSPLVALARGGGGKGGSYGKPSVSGGSYGKPSSGSSSRSYSTPTTPKSGSSSGSSSVGGSSQAKPAPGSVASQMPENQGSRSGSLPTPIPVPVPGGSTNYGTPPANYGNPGYSDDRYRSYSSPLHSWSALSFLPFFQPGFLPWGYSSVGTLLGPGYFLGKVLSLLPLILLLMIAWRILRNVFRR